MKKLIVLEIFSLKRLVISILSLLIATLLFSQETYPKRIIIENDTFVVITPQQVRDINFEYANHNSDLSKLKQLTLLLNKYDDNTDKLVTINRKLKEENSKTIDDYRTLIKLNKTNQSLSDYYKKEAAVQKRKKTIGTIGGFSVGVLTGSVLILLLK